MPNFSTFDKNAVGATVQQGGPIGVNLLVRDDGGKEIHRLGQRTRNQSGCWVYVRFGEDVEQGDLVMFDELYGAERTVEAENAIVDDDSTTTGNQPNNGALKIRPSDDGPAVRFVGVVVDASAEKGDYGWVMEHGMAPVKVAFGTVAITPTSGTTSQTEGAAAPTVWGCARTNGALSPSYDSDQTSADATNNAVIHNITLPRGTAAGTSGTVVGLLAFPSWQAGDALDLSAVTQPTRDIKMVKPQFP